MHPIARILAVAYVGLAVVGGVVYAEMTATYVDVARIENELPRNVEVTRVDIAWSGNTSETAHVSVFVKVTNPGRIVVGIQILSFALHIDNPYDNRSWADLAKLVTTFIQEGGFDQAYDPPIPVAPGETRVLEVVVNVDPSRMGRFNRPDGAGRFHPVVWNVLVVYKLLDGRAGDHFYVAPYYDAAGVVPNAP